MRLFVRFALIFAILGFFAKFTEAQPPKADTKSATKSAEPPRPAILDQVLATVNGKPIIREELYRLLEAAGIPPGASIDEDQEIYNSTIEQLVSRELLKQYLKKQPSLVVSESEVESEFAAFAEQFKKAKQDVNVALAQHGVTVAQVKEDMRDLIRFRKYIEAVANDANLKKFVADNKDFFNETQVRASQIQVMLERNPKPADKEAAKKKLLEIKQEIESKKITFADAANKYSDDDSNKSSPRGGDVGYFKRRGIIEQLAGPAFAMKVGAISDPIETPFGYHLVMVTDRKEGTPIDFEQKKMLIRNEYGADLHERIIAQEKKTAKVKIEPMPADFFPKTNNPTAPTTEPGKAATPGKAAAPR